MTTPVTILEGPFMGFKGTVLRPKGDQFVVAVNVFGRTTEVTLGARELGFPAATLDVLEGEVLEAVARRGFRQRLFHFWQQEAKRQPPRAEEEVARAYEAASAQLLREEEAAQVLALKRFRAEYGSLDAPAREAKWSAERGAWTAWREEAKAVTDPLDAALFSGLEGEARQAEEARLRDAAFALRQTVEAWRRRHAFDAPPEAEPRNVDLEARIEADPEAEAPFLVYGDWLCGQGDPRGDLIALQAAGDERKTAEAALRRKLAPRLLGPLAPYEDRLEAKWRLGFLTALKVEATREDERAGVDVVKLLEAALRLPSARFLRALTLGCPSAHEAGVVERLHRALAAAPRPLLRSLAFNTNEGEEMLSWTSAGELGALGAVFPRLEVLDVRAGSFQLTAPAFGALKALRLKTCGLTEAAVAALATAEWPALEELEVWVGSASSGVRVTADHFEALFASPGLPALKRLALSNCEFTDALCAQVLRSPLLPRLEELSLTMGTMTEAGAQLLALGAAQLRHLKVLDVDDNYLPAGALEALQQALPQTHSAGQRTPEEFEGALHRYASVGE